MYTSTPSTKLFNFFRIQFCNYWKYLIEHKNNIIFIGLILLFKDIVNALKSKNPSQPGQGYTEEELRMNMCFILDE